MGWRDVYNFARNNAPFLTLCTFLILLWFSNGYSDVINMGPIGIHQWRQADGASQALNYFQHDILFWTPQVHNLDGKNGFAAGEFPVIYWIAGQLYKLFGSHDGILRCLTYMFSLVGWLSAFFLGKMVIRNAWLALIPVGFLLTIPFHQYYAFSTMPDMAAFGMGMLGIYAWFRYMEKGKAAMLFLSGIVFSLGMLIKISSALSFLAIVSLIFFRIAADKNYRTRIVPKLKIIIPVFLAAIALPIAWVLYARWFDHQNATNYFLLTISPIWKMNENEIVSVLEVLWIRWLPELICNEAIFLLLGMAILLFIFRRRANRDIVILSAFLFIGSICFMALFFRNFDFHDYYLTSIAFLPFTVIMASTIVLRTIIESRPLPWMLSGIVIAIVFGICILKVRKIQLARNREVSGQFFNSDLRNLGTFLQRHGIEKDDLIVSVPDQSPNVTLYFLNRMGWTELYNKPKYNIELFRKEGAKYLVVNGKIDVHPEWYEKYSQPDRKVADTLGITIYKL